MPGIGVLLDSIYLLGEKLTGWIGPAHLSFIFICIPTNMYNAIGFFREGHLSTTLSKLQEGRIHSSVCEIIHY